MQEVAKRRQFVAVQDGENRPTDNASHQCSVLQKKRTPVLVLVRKRAVTCIHRSERVPIRSSLFNSFAISSIDSSFTCCQFLRAASTIENPAKFQRNQRTTKKINKVHPMLLRCLLSSFSLLLLFLARSLTHMLSHLYNCI